MASQALSEYRVMADAASVAGVTPIEIKEIVYYAVPYVGMARVFDYESSFCKPSSPAICFCTASPFARPLRAPCPLG
jgi:hypothetical protein